MKRDFWIKKIMGFIVLGILAVFLFGWIVMLLWNNILPAVLHVQPVSFWQALGLLVLCKILFGGFGGGRGGKEKWGRKMQEKWQTMSPEEQQHWKEEMRNRCRTWRKPATTQAPGDAAAAEGIQ